MARSYKEMLPLWYLEGKVALSDQYPSGLQWVEANGWHKAGEMAGKLVPNTGYYAVYLSGAQYMAHRLVYFLRTGVDPGRADVMHTADNLDKDNRKELSLYYRKSIVRTKRRYQPDFLEVPRSLREIERQNNIKIER
jgi:hypothetical protein